MVIKPRFQLYSYLSRCYLIYKYHTKIQKYHTKIQKQERGDQTYVQIKKKIIEN